MKKSCSNISNIVIYICICTYNNPGKLIGTINCVNINDPLDAYAIFIDKLL